VGVRRGDRRHGLGYESLDSLADAVVLWLSIATSIFAAASTGILKAQTHGTWGISPVLSLLMNRPVIGSRTCPVEGSIASAQTLSGTRADAHTDNFGRVFCGKCGNSDRAVCEIGRERSAAMKPNCATCAHTRRSGRVHWADNSLVPGVRLSWSSASVEASPAIGLVEGVGDVDWMNAQIFNESA
jgi:hypothetical protein